MHDVRCLAHALDAAGQHHAGFPELHHLGAADGRLNPGGAQPVDRQRRYLDRHAGFQGDLVEAGLPLGGGRACAFGCHDQHEIIVGVELVDDLADEVLGRAAVDGNAAESAHEVAHWPCEQTVLADETDLPPQRMNGAEKDEEVPIGRVGRAHDHEFAIGRELSGGLPAAPVVPGDQQPPDDAFEKVQTRGGQRRISRGPIPGSRSRTWRSR